LSSYFSKIIHTGFESVLHLKPLIGGDEKSLSRKQGVFGKIDMGLTNPLF